MNRLVTILFCFLSAVPLYCQTNKYWQSNENWSILVLTKYPLGEPYAITALYDSIAGDTMIGAEVYKKAYNRYREGMPLFSAHPLQGSATAPIALLKERNDTVTIISISQQDTLRIHYSDTAISYRINPPLSWDSGGVEPVEVVDSIRINGVWRKKYRRINYGYYAYEGAFNLRFIDNPVTSNRVQDVICGDYSWVLLDNLSHDVHFLCYSGNDSSYIDYSGPDVMLSSGQVLVVPEPGNCGIQNIWWSALDEEELKTEWFYFNPSNEWVQLTIPENHLGSLFTIFDVRGQVIQRGSLVAPFTVIDVQNFAAGMYIFRWEKQGVLESRKFVKL